MNDLTDQQQRLLDAIRDHWHAYSHAPTLMELAAVLGHANASAVLNALNHLGRRGLVEWDDRSSRTIKIVGETYADLLKQKAELVAALKEIVAAGDAYVNPPEDDDDVSLMLRFGDADKAARAAIANAEPQA